MCEELKEKGDWVPLTPVKLVQIPRKQGHAALNSEKESGNVNWELGNSNYSGLCFASDHENDKQFDARDYSAGAASNLGDVFRGNSGKSEECLGLQQNSKSYTDGISDTIYQETSEVELPSACTTKNQFKNEHTRGNFGMDSTAKPSNTPNNPIPKKTSNCDARVKRKRRPKMKRHRPKVYDESKPVKTPKSQINPLTPKQKAPKRAISKTSPFEKRKYARNENARDAVGESVGIVTYSCRKRLNFSRENHVGDEKGRDNYCGNEGKTDFKALGTFLQKDCRAQLEDGFQLSTNDLNVHGHVVDPFSDHAGISFTDLLNESCASQAKGNQNTEKGKELCEELLKLDSKLNLEAQHFECCSGLRAIIQEYQQQKKSSNPPQKEDLNVDKKINTAKVESSHFQVYRRIFRPNECLKNSRKLGPNFPKIYKKKRMKRKRGTVSGYFLCERKVDPCIRQKETSPKRGFSSRNVKKIVKRGSSLKSVGGKRPKKLQNNNRSSDRIIIKHNINVIQPTQRQRIEAMDDQVSFVCVRSLCPMGNFRKKRSCTPIRKKECWSMHLSTGKEIAEEMKHEKPQCATPLTWLVKRKGKRSQITPQGHDLSSFCEESEFFSLTTTSVLTEEDTFVQSLIDFITTKFEKLCVDDVCNQLVVLNQKVNGALLPHRGKFDLSKKRKLLPKVDLDAETIRVWKLLMENDGSEGVEEMDEVKAKWWEDQIEIFRGRIDSFISCMHLIQGDRRFSPWKGSVVDSVVGVFLTQNVSDHLSSSAFMSLAARFPPPFRSKKGDSNKNSECQEFVNNNEADFRQSTNGNDEQLCLNSTEINMEEGCRSSECHQEFVNNNEAEIRQSTNGNDEQLCLNSTEINMEEGCSFSTTKSLGEDESICRDAVRSNQDSFCHESSTTNSRLCSSENAIFREVLQVEENEFLQKFYSHEESIMSCDRSIDDMTFGDGLCAPESTSHRSSTSISRFREVLQVEETEYLHKFYIHEENIVTFDERISEMKFEDSQNMACALRSDETCDMKGNAASCLPLSQNLVEDIGNMKLEGSHYISRHHESTGGRKTRQVKEKQDVPIKWDDLRKKYSCSRSKDPTCSNIDSVNWEAVRQASIEEIAKVIMERGMNNILAGRIKDFLDRMVEDHGTIDLEWLRDVPPDKARNYLLSIPGLGLKSTECVCLLTLCHHAFPVDTNVGRILVRLGWVPLLPLPEDVQIHLLNQYPVVDTIQKYIWPRLCTFAKQTLYECHYQMITFGKVFCTKIRPNCNACPMRGQCRHFASAYASARLRLRGAQGKSEEPMSTGASSQEPMDSNQPLLVHFDGEISGLGNQSYVPEPIVEFPPSPAPDSREILERDIEDFDYDTEDEIPTIKLNQEEFTKNILDFIEKTSFLCGVGAMSKELVALDPEAASIPIPKLKFVGRLRTVHQVYELPDSHPLLAGFGKREPDDPCPYLLAIWTTDESVNYSQPPGKACSCQESASDFHTCCSGDTIKKHSDELIQGTILIPCRTANWGSFPLNGTYFQVNEVFADHESSHRPLAVPRKWIWNLRRRFLYCGTSTTSIFRGMATDEIQYCFWKGFICVKGIDRLSMAPKPLARRFHICKTRQVDE